MEAVDETADIASPVPPPNNLELEGFCTSFRDMCVILTFGMTNLQNNETIWRSQDDWR